MQFTYCNKCTTLGLDIMVSENVCGREGAGEEGEDGVEKGMYGNSVLPDQFYCELKTALKIKIIHKNYKLKG